MIQVPDVPDAMSQPTGPTEPTGSPGPTEPTEPTGSPGPGPRGPLVIGLTLLAITVALVLFFTLVVIPEAGAAGGCGGG